MFNLYGQTATILYKDNSEVEIKVIHRFPDKIEAAWDSNIQTSTNLFELRKSDII